MCLRETDKMDKDIVSPVHAVVTSREREKFVDKAKLAPAEVAEYLSKLMSSSESGDNSGQSVRNVTSEGKSGGGDGQQSQAKSNVNIVFLPQVC